MSDIKSLTEELKRAELNLKAVLHEDGGVWSKTKWTVAECKEKLFDALTADVTLDRLRELVEADKDERCVVLPKEETEIERLREAITSVHESLDFADTQRQSCKNYTELAINNGLALGQIAVTLKHDFKELEEGAEK